MQGLYHKFAAIWSGHVRFLPHCFFSQKISLMEPARLLTQFPSSKEDADCIPTCEWQCWSFPALQRMLRVRSVLAQPHQNAQFVGETHPVCPAPWSGPPHCSWTLVTNQIRHGKCSWVATDLSANIHLAQALHSPFLSHTTCNLQGRWVFPAAGCSMFAGALGVVCPVPLGHALSGPSAEGHLGCSCYWKKHKNFSDRRADQ